MKQESPAFRHEECQEYLNKKNKNISNRKKRQYRNIIECEMGIKRKVEDEEIYYYRRKIC
jgi:hypothetical protein